MKKTDLTIRRAILCACMLLLVQTLMAQQLLKDIWSGTGNSSPESFTTYNGKLYFVASDSLNGKELWITDGTDTGTKLFLDIRTGTDASAPDNIVTYKNHLYFLAQTTNSSFTRKVYRTDGTTTENLDVFWPSAKVTSSEELVVSGDYIYFTGYNGDIGREIFYSDGTDAGTDGKDVYPFKDFNGFPLSSSPSGLTDAGGVVFFNGYWQTKGTDPYYVDGTTLKGTVDVNPNLGNSSARDFTRMGDYVYFSATRDKKASINGPDNDEGNELWRVKIGSALPQLVKNIYTGAYNSSNPRNFFKWGDSLVLFSANNGNGTALWKTDGTANGTVKVSGAPTAPKNFMVFKNTVYFTSNGNIWKTDGTLTGTVPVTNSLNITSALTRINNRLYFVNDEATYGEELWETDGTTGGTKLVKDIYTGTASSSPQNLFVHNNILYFTAKDTNTGYELYSYLDTCNAFEVSLNYSGSVGLCSGDTVHLKAGAANSYTWLLNGSVLTTNTDSIAVSTTGNYSLVTDNGNGCVDTTDWVTVAIYAKPSNKILLPDGNSLCKGGKNISLVPETINSNYQYQWIEKGVDMNNVDDTTITTNRTSNFQVRITNGGCVVTTDTVFTYLLELPQPNIPTGNIDLCEGSKMVLDPGSFEKYLWATGNDTTQTIEVTTGGNYKVTVTDTNMCSASGTFKIVERQNPSVTLTKYGNTFEATSAAGDSYTWLRNGVSINGANQSTYSPTQAGDFAVVAKNQYGCTDTSTVQSFVLSVNKGIKGEVKVYPNPAKDVVNISLFESTTGTAIITDIQGKTIQQQPLNATENSIAIAHLKQGIYYITVQTQNGSATYKLLKQ